jgi:hypothetical protein
MHCETINIFFQLAHVCSDVSHADPSDHWVAGTALRIPLGTWMSLSYECRQVAASALG